MRSAESPYWTVDSVHLVAYYQMHLENQAAAVVEAAVAVWASYYQDSTLPY